MTHLRVQFVELHHNFSQKFVAWSIFGVEVDTGSTESSDQGVHLIPKCSKLSIEFFNR